MACCWCEKRKQERAAKCCCGWLHATRPGAIRPTQAAASSRARAWACKHSAFEESNRAQRQRELPTLIGMQPDLNDSECSRRSSDGRGEPGVQHRERGCVLRGRGVSVSAVSTTAVSLAPFQPRQLHFIRENQGLRSVATVSAGRCPLCAALAATALVAATTRLRVKYETARLQGNLV
eukprot:3526393-Rhodomonas_salina.1